MVKYEYNPNIEGFKRVDNRGYTLDIDIVEARRIVALRNLGYTLPDIFKEMELARKISISTLRSFLRNYEQGNISIEGDFPIPQKSLEEMDNEVRMTNIEDRIEALEKKVESMSVCNCEDKREHTITGRVKEWFKK